MTTITHRVGKSRNLTPDEVDANFDRLNAAILALGGGTGGSSGGIDGGTATSNETGTVAIDGGTATSTP